jgi:hypothetical protein
MSDFAVSAAIRAIDKFSSVFHGMGDAVGRFGTQSGSAFDKAGKKASLFKSIFAGNFMANWANDIRRVIFREIKQIPQMIEDFVGATMDIGRSATMLGLTTDAFQRLSYAAKLTDTTTESMEGAFKKLNMGMAQFRVGAGPLHSLMQKINPALARQMRTVKDSKDAFLLVADAMSRTTNAQTRAAIAQAAFGKAGQEMIPMLLQGRVGLEKLMQEASIYGTVLDDKAIAASEHLEDTLKRLKGSIKSVKDQVLGFIVQAITPYIEKAMVWIAAHKDLIAIKIQDFIAGFIRVIKDARPFVEFIINAVGWLVRNWPVLAGVYAAWAIAQLALNIAMDANPVGAVILAIEAMIAVVIIVIHYWKQITGALQAAWNWFNNLFGNPWIRTALYLISAPISLIAGFIQTIVDLFSGKGWQSLLNMMGPLKAFTDALGITQAGGQWTTPYTEPKPPNAEKMEGQGMRWNGHIWVHAEPGTTAKIENQSGAPAILGYAGAQYSGGAH